MILVFRHKQRIDDDEFDKLFRSSYPVLYRRAYSLLNNGEDSRDVVSDVFKALLEKQTDISSINIGYLTAMVQNRALDLLRHRNVEDEARQQMIYEYHTAIQTDRNYEERLKEILQFIETDLTPQTRMILRMCYDDKKSYKEVAEELNISKQAVNKHISQALRKLRERFNPRQHQ